MKLPGGITISKRSKHSEDKEKQKKRPDFSTETDKLRGQLTTAFISETFETLKEDQPDEVLRIGRRLLSGLLDAGKDPEKTLILEEMQNDPEFRQRLKELHISEREARIVRSKRHPYGEEEDEGEATFTQLGREILLERLQGGGGENSAVMAALAKALAPGGALTQLLILITQQQQRGLPNGETIQLEGQQQHLISGEEQMPTPATSPMLMDLFSAHEVGLLLAESDPQVAAATAWENIKAKMAATSNMEQVKTIAMLREFLRIQPNIMLMLLTDYERYTDWAQVIAYSKANEAHFAAFLTCLKETVTSEEETV